MILCLSQYCLHLIATHCVGRCLNVTMIILKLPSNLTWPYNAHPDLRDCFVFLWLGAELEASLGLRWRSELNDMHHSSILSCLSTTKHERNIVVLSIMILWYRHLQEVCENSFSCEGYRTQTIFKWILHLVVYYLARAREKIMVKTSHVVPPIPRLSFRHA